MSYTEEITDHQGRNISFVQGAQSALFRLADLTLGSRGKQSLSILIYHSVAAEPDWMRPAVPSADKFKWHMQILRQHFNVLPLRQAVRLMREGRLPPRAVCVTFDDGYADNLLVAAPIMRQLNIPATFFVATGYLDGGRMWNDTVIEALRHYPGEQLNLSGLALPVYDLSTTTARRQAAYDIINQIKYLEEERRNEIALSIGSLSKDLSADLMMTRDQVRELRGLGMEIGGHTVSHPILARIPGARAREEIEAGKAALETILGEPIHLFAYPNGLRGTDYQSEHVKYVQEAGFEAAVITNRGVSGRTTDPYQMARFTPWDKTTARFLLRMALNARHRA